MVLHCGVDGILSHCAPLQRLNPAPDPHLSFVSLPLSKDKEMIALLLYIQLLR